MTAQKKTPGTIPSEFLKIEEQNDGVIYLFKSGNFWNAYDFSAYLLRYKLDCKMQKDFEKYKINPKMHKGILQYVSIGFPNIVTERLAASLNSSMYEKIDVGNAVIKIQSKHHKFEKTQDYIDWKNKELEYSKEMRNIAESIAAQQEKEMRFKADVHQDAALPEFAESLKSNRAYQTANKLYVLVFKNTASVDKGVRALRDHIRQLAVEICENLHCHLLLETTLSIRVPLEKLNFNLRKLMEMKYISIGCWKSLAETINEIKNALAAKRAGSEAEPTATEKPE